MTNLLSWSIQVLAIAAIGAGLPLIFRVRHPRTHLRYCYGLLIICLALPFIQTWQHPVVSFKTGTQVALSTTDASAQDFARLQTTFPWERVLLGMLLTGFILRMGWFVAGLWQIRRYRQSARPLFPVPESAAAARELAGSDAEICVSSVDVGPVTFGLRRPIVLLPESFLTLSNDAQRAIVCHELLHVKRRDWLVTVIEELVGAGLWFHPAVWWLLNQTKLAREQVVDAEVVRLTDATEPYIGALLTMSGADPSHGFITAPGFLRKRHLALRMRSLLMEVPMSRLRLLVSYVSMTCVLVAAGWLTLNAFPLIGQPQIQEGAVADGAGVSVDPGGGVLHRTPISYPAEAQQNQIHGTVVVGLTLNAKGEVIDAHVVSGPDELRKDVLQSVLQWRYVANVSTRSIQAKVDFQGQTATKENPPKAVVPAAPKPGSTPPAFTIVTTVPAQTNSQESDLERKLREQTPGRPYVIADDEKAAYDRLTTDEEREHFIEQFWQRREEAARTNLALAGPQEVLSVGGNVKAPRILTKVDPQYSAEARAVRLSGTVVVEAVVEKDGSIQVLRIIRSLGFGLDEAAVEALQQWRFSPATLNGEPVAVRLNMEVNFNMNY